jgi:hypothetical protein
MQKSETKKSISDVDTRILKLSTSLELKYFTIWKWIFKLPLSVAMQTFKREE